MDQSIVSYIKKKYKLMIGERTAEEIKIEIGSAIPAENGEEEIKEIRGRDLVTGLPKVLEINSGEIREALQEPVTAIIEAVKSTLEQTPPELAADIMDRGIILTGGGALLKALDKCLMEETQMPVHLAEDALDCVAKGTGAALEEIKSLKGLLVTPKRIS